ncbi:MAG: hypothetical protein IJ243_09195 [Prevotella sp.]|nr:hypothetical protein [Prevotella sp.]
MQKQQYMTPRAEIVNVKFDAHLLIVSGDDEEQPQSLRYGGDDEGYGESE